MYVISGADAKYLSMDETFVGWGGEVSSNGSIDPKEAKILSQPPVSFPPKDNDFYSRVGDTLNIIRLHEKGLTHVWHPKDCELGSFVENNFFKSWYASLGFPGLLSFRISF